MKFEETVRDFIKSIQEPQKKRTSAYDSKGIVTRIEEGIAWVKLAGSKIETPLQMTISAEPGDEVQARIGNGTGWLTGNGTAPPTDDSMAKVSYRAARRADEKAVNAQNAAAEAFNSAEAAAEAASSAIGSAAAAQESANIAKGAADTALKGLAEVEDVVDTLTWFSQHITQTTDTVVDASKTYYEKVGSVYTVVENPTGNPSQQGWYTINQSIVNYIASHLALTNNGLYLIMDGSAYQLRIHSQGIEVLDGSLNVVASFGTTIQLGKNGSTRATLSNNVFKFLNSSDVEVAKFKAGEILFKNASKAIAQIIAHTSGLGDHVGLYLNAKYGDSLEDAGLIEGLSNTLLNKYQMSIGSYASSSHTAELRITTYEKVSDGYQGYSGLTIDKNQVIISAKIETGDIYLKSGNTYNTGTWHNSSDGRYKEKLETLENYEELFEKLQPVKYEWTEDYKHTDHKKHFGFKAQEVEQAMSEAGFDPGQYALVDDNGEYMSIAYMEMIPMCIHMIQKQGKTISDLEKRIEELEKGE